MGGNTGGRFSAMRRLRGGWTWQEGFKPDGSKTRWELVAQSRRLQLLANGSGQFVQRWLLRMFVAGFAA